MTEEERAAFLAKYTDWPYERADVRMQTQPFRSVSPSPWRPPRWQHVVADILERANHCPTCGLREVFCACNGRQPEIWRWY